MPPVPAVLDEQTNELISNVRRRLADLQEFQVPRLRQCDGPLLLQQQLAAELREDIDAFAHSVQSLQDMIDDQRSESKRVELRKVVEELQKSLTGLKIESRAALLESKRLLDSKKQSQREELLRSSVLTEKPAKEEKATDDVIMKANEDVTEALRRTLNIMQGELEKSVLNSQMLDSSTAMLKSTSATHDTLTNLMDTSRQLITALEKSDWLDRLLIFFAFTFFILVVLLILKQRILDRSIRIAFWWTRFFPDFSGDAELLDLASETVDKLQSETMTPGISTTELVNHVISTASVVITSAASSTTGKIVAALSRHKARASSSAVDVILTDAASKMPTTSSLIVSASDISSESDALPSSTTDFHIEL